MGCALKAVIWPALAVGCERPKARGWRGELWVVSGCRGWSVACCVCRCGCESVGVECCELQLLWWREKKEKKRRWVGPVEKEGKEKNTKEEGEEAGRA